MHRKTTTATLLVTVAVSALSGCTTVQQSAVPVPPPPTPSRPTAPRADGPTEQPVVQAPAREALTLIGPSRRPEPTPSTARSRSAAAPMPGPPAPRPRPHTRPEHHAPGRPTVEVPERPPAKAPAVSEPVGGPEAPKNGDVCTMGRKYGGWKSDSPESRICDQTYGQ
ncbi:hypothetical protein [Streptomyces sp. HD]|uniref:hypothetical protein n=1 Tax=Streptomyces sp. HD TaxID=3020892 RepID=UPI00232B3B0A|nr:hypothetical protein [Streptomyces sp. HD]MDC0770596.1 hypothetical protein [Streptomyces sp. HD]